MPKNKKEAALGIAKISMSQLLTIHSNLIRLQDCLETINQEIEEAIFEVGISISKVNDVIESLERK